MNIDTLKKLTPYEQCMVLLLERIAKSLEKLVEIDEAH